VVFHEDEREVLTRTLERLEFADITPRSMRAFVLRYQLVRLVLQQLRKAFEPSDVVPALAAKLFPGSMEPAELKDPIVQNAIEMVV